MRKIFYENIEIKLSFNKRNGDFYIYKIEFPDDETNGVIPYYYGRAKYKGDFSKHKYIGTPLKYKQKFLDQINKNNKITKEIIYTFSKNEECAIFEKNLIDNYYGKEGCLNGSIFSPLIPKEELIKNAKKAYAAGLGKLTNEERKRIQREGIAKKIKSKVDYIEYYKKIGTNGGKIGGKKAYLNKSGIHDINNSIVANGRAKGHKKIAEKYGREFSIIDPKGNLLREKNLAKFCRENNLNKSNIRLLLRGKIKSSLGWTKPMPEEESNL